MVFATKTAMVVVSILFTVVGAVAIGQGKMDVCVGGYGCGCCVVAEFGYGMAAVGNGIPGADEEKQHQRRKYLVVGQKVRHLDPAAV